MSSKGLGQGQEAVGAVTGQDDLRREGRHGWNEADSQRGRQEGKARAGAPGPPPGYNEAAEVPSSGSSKMGPLKTPGA